MKVYAIRCCRADQADEKICWKVGDWVGNSYMNGNGTTDFEMADLFTESQKDILMEIYLLFIEFGIEFEAVAFVQEKA